MANNWNPTTDHYLKLVRPITVLQFNNETKEYDRVTLQPGTVLQPYMVDQHPKNDNERQTPILAIYDGMILRLGRGVSQYVPSKKIREIE